MINFMTPAGNVNNSINMENPYILFSIIIPVYNDDIHLPRCLDSILSQTYQEFECLLIDDGSTDNCYVLCDSYSNKDKRIIVYHKENEGISKTRQFGLDRAKGSYIFFIDSDDWIESSYFDNVYKVIKDENTDIIYTNFYRESFNRKQKLYIQKPDVNNNEKIIKQVVNAELFSCLWNFIIRKNFYIDNKLKFHETINYGEDSLFILEALFYKPKIKRINCAFYHHTFNKSSFTQINKREKFIERIKFNEQLDRLFEKYNRFDLKKYNFIRINDKYEMLLSGLFSKEEYHNLFTINISFGYLKQFGVYKYILLSLAETNLYYHARSLLILTRNAVNKTKNTTVLINGDFLCRRLTGIERYAYEITLRLDKNCKSDEIMMIIPNNVVNVPEFANLKLIWHKKDVKSHLWWQMITLQWFLVRNREYTVLDFGNTALPFAPGIVFLHDIYCEFFPKDFKSFLDRITRIYNRLQYRLIARNSKHIVTVSNFSKNQIIQYCKAKPENISVVYSSWYHFKNITADYSILNDFPVLSKQFYFSLGSLSKRKNIKWIIEYAGKNPGSFFAISGASLPTVKVDELNSYVPQNIILLGYLDDSKVKALMEHCKAFILPSYYEGFGLTPLEALSCGAQIIIAKAASLPEIYGKTAHYIDPFNTDIDLDALLSEPVEKPDEILAKYSYDASAEKVYNLIRECTK
jgi:glycosyltransferase involved in cell wall biosynthesis